MRRKEKLYDYYKILFYTNKILFLLQYIFIQKSVSIIFCCNCNSMRMLEGCDRQFVTAVSLRWSPLDGRQ